MLLLTGFIVYKPNVFLFSIKLVPIIVYFLQLLRPYTYVAVCIFICLHAFIIIVCNRSYLWYRDNAILHKMITVLLFARCNKFNSPYYSVDVHICMYCMRDYIIIIYKFKFI